MIAELPMFISSNNSISAGIRNTPSTLYSQDPHHQPTTPHNDDQLHKKMYEQLKVVNQMQQSLLIEQKKLEITLKEFQRRNAKRKKEDMKLNILLKPPKHSRLHNNTYSHNETRMNYEYLNSSSGPNPKFQENNQENKS